jgi:hypothetical protein
VPLTPHIAALVQTFRETESSTTRGPLFETVALALEKQMKVPGVSAETILECFGPPDLWSHDTKYALYVYFFDVEEPGRNKEEWYFHLTNQKLTGSGHNLRGINNLSHLKTKSEWPPPPPVPPEP